MLPSEVSVLIVGAGPSGLMTTLMLERLGIETSGALLIRTDQHVAGRATTQSRHGELAAAVAHAAYSRSGLEG
jgi:cation diffusion facilitator CzcD-associated flavoprotein CzcO